MTEIVKAAAIEHMGREKWEKLEGMMLLVAAEWGLDNEDQRALEAAFLFRPGPFTYAGVPFRKSYTGSSTADGYPGTPTAP